MYGYIYKTTNLINNKIYVGQHKAKQFELESYRGSGILLLKAIEKYGSNNFKCEVIEICESKDDLNNREKFWISKLHPDYNISEGGNGGDLGKEVNARISKTVKNQWKAGIFKPHPNSGFKKGCVPWNKGKQGTFTGRTHSKETRLKISLALKGRKPSEEQCRRHSERMKGHIVSEETRRKMSEHNCMKNPVYKEKARVNKMKKKLLKKY